MQRRTFLKQAVPAAAICALPRLSLGARTPALQTAALSDRLTIIRGGGGNVVVFDSPEGVLLVDGGAPEYSKQLLGLVRKHTGASRVHTLFNTHWHWEHTGSNRTLGPAGTRIIAHENTKLWLGTEVHCKWQDRRYEPLPKEARPNETFYTAGSLAFGGERIDYGYLLQAHTDSDIYVFFRNANVLVAGDVLSVGAYPILDYSTNGWIGGMADATRMLADLCDGNTRVVPGAGPVQSKSDLEAQHQMLKTLKERMSQLLAQGMSVDDMIAAAPTKEFDAKWGDPRLFIANVWHGLVPRARELGVSIV
jgi:cyclase